MKLEIKDVNKYFSGKHILKDINFSVSKGRCMGFLGPNGAGKTTTFRCLMDVFKADSGKFIINGEELDHSKHRVGYLPEERGLYNKVNILDQLIYFSMLRGADRASAKKSANEWIDFFGLNEYIKKPVETLSKGNQQKVQIAQAFLNDPEILILDEPFSGLDPVNSQIFKDAIKMMIDRGKILIFSSHQMAYVEEICQDITIIDNGTIKISGDLEKIKEEEGKGRILIVSKEANNKALEEILMNNFSYKKNDRNYLISLKEGQVLKDVFLTSQDIMNSIESIGEFRPSMHDIFVTKVGGNNEGF